MTTDTLTGITLSDRYRIDWPVGRGGMGVVYRAHHLMLDRTVAVKFLRPQFVADERAVGRFLREARAMARIEHPNAVSVHDSGVLPDGTAYLVMEYIEGESLRALLARSGPLPVAHAVLIAEQVCGAVDAAHRQGVVHRDLKPENVMLKRAGAGFVAKVVDFGLAKILGHAPVRDDGHHVTAAGEFFGTPAYMAPEFCQGDDIDGRADVYAIGILLYEMLSGKPPFQGSLQTVLSGHLFKAPPPLPPTANVPPAVDGVIQLALRKLRAERPASAADLAELLRAACPGLARGPVPLPPGSVTLATDSYPTDAPTASSLSSLATLTSNTSGVSGGEQATLPGGATVPGISQRSLVAAAPPETVAAALAARPLGRTRSLRGLAAASLVACFGVAFIAVGGLVDLAGPGAGAPASAYGPGAKTPDALPAIGTSAAGAERVPEGETGLPRPAPVGTPAVPPDIAAPSPVEPRAGGGVNQAKRAEQRGVKKADGRAEPVTKAKKRKWFDPRKWL